MLENMQRTREDDLLRANDDWTDSCWAAPRPDNFQTGLPSSSLSRLMDEVRLSLPACRFSALLALESNNLAVLSKRSIWDDLEGLQMSQEVVSGAISNKVVEAEAEVGEKDPLATVLMPYSEFD